MILDEKDQSETLLRSFQLLKSINGKVKSTDVDFRFSNIISKLIYSYRLNQKKLRVLINHRLKPGEGKCFNFKSGSIIVISPNNSTIEKELNLTTLLFHELMHALIHDVRKRGYAQSLQKLFSYAQSIIHNIDQAPPESTLKNHYWSSILAYHYKINRTEDVLIRMMEKEQFFVDNLNVSLREVEQPYQKQMRSLRQFSFYFFQKIIRENSFNAVSEKPVCYKTLPAYKIN